MMAGSIGSEVKPSYSVGNASKCSIRLVLVGLVLYGVAPEAQPSGASGENNQEQAAMVSTVRAAFARKEVTPSGTVEMPGGFSKRFCEGAHDPLWVEAVVFANDTVRVALVGVDALMVADDVVRSAREQAQAHCGIPASHILIAASHTHTGGPIIECFSSERDPAYCTYVAQRIAEAIAEADGALAEVEVAVGVGHEDSVAFNRRFFMKDGSVLTHPGKMNLDILKPAGPTDPKVAVIAVSDRAGKLMGCAVNYALHATTMSGNQLSADWPFYMRETVRGALGADIGVVFLNGACGDVTQVDNQSARPSEFGQAWARRVGMTVGAEVLKVLARAEFAEDVPLAVLTRSIELPIRDLAQSDEMILARERPPHGLGSSVEEVWRRELALVREMRAKSPVVSAEIQVIRVGNGAIVTNPTELFCELGLAIKRQSAWQPTLVVELANGYAGYAPAAKAFEEGGYEVRTARSSFLAPGAGETLVAESLRLLRSLP